MEAGKEFFNSDAIKLDKADSNWFSCKIFEYLCVYEKYFRPHTASSKHMKKTGIE